MINCPQCRDELAEYALGQSDAVRAAAIQQHLGACAMCRRELAEIEEAWAALPAALEPVGPAPEVLERVLAQTNAGHPEVPRGIRAASESKFQPSLSRRTRWASYALAASVALGLTLGAIVLRQRSADVASRDAAAEQAVQDLATRLGKLQQLERLLQSGQVKSASLHKPNAANNGSDAYVVWDLAARQWHFFALALPPADAGRTYQLWAARGDSPMLAGPTFTVDGAGLGSAVADFPTLDPAAPAVKVVVTLEPTGGSRQPTSAPVLEATL